MQQLNGLDAFFAHGESPRMPMHVGALLVYKQQGKLHPDARYQQLKQRFSRVPAIFPLFGRRLVRVPGGLDHPYWVEAGGLTMDAHFHRHRLRHGETYQDLEELLARLHSQPLDFSRPLWEIHVIEGLGALPDYPDNSFGLYAKIHHAAVDGISGTEIISALHQSEFLDTPLPAAAPAEQPPSLPHMLARASLNGFQSGRELLAQGRQFLPMLRGAGDPTSLGHTPRPGWQRSPFNVALSSKRQLCSLHFALDELNQIRRHYPGTTLNHVLLTILSLGLRRYLIARNRLPDLPLGALVPVNLRKDGVANGGNMLGMMIAGLRCDIDDPLQCLKAVRDGAVSGRQRSAQRGEGKPMELLKHVPSLPERSMIWALSTLCRVPGGPPMPVNTVLSNIPGPRQTLKLGDAKLVDAQAIGLVVDGCGLFHTALSYAGRVCLTALSTPEAVSHPRHYRRCLERAHRDLLAASAPADPPSA